MSTDDLQHLIQLFAKLPGLGPRSARRSVLHLIQQKEKLMRPLTSQLTKAMETVRSCGHCGNLDVHDPCYICADARRDASVICVIEDVADLWAMERTHVYRGYYHVLGGTLSAIDGRGPEQLRIPMLLERAGNELVTEVILATNATVDGQTTAHYLSSRLTECNVRITRLAQGIPMGAELDYLDDGTLDAALQARTAC